jgi:glycosyltransferase involved in cell wall biosynthesis
MKIVHLNTHSYGGAAVVARRLHLAGLAAGLDSHLVTKYGIRSDRTINYAALRDARWLYAARATAAYPSLHRLGKFVQRQFTHRNLANRPAGYEVFSPLNDSGRFADCAERFDPAIIHLHWVAGFVDHEAFFARNQRRRFVWTLHDMNPITGGCHHADGCDNFRRGCTRCPQLTGTIDPGYAALVLQAKRAALAGLRDDQVIITAPSRWLLELAQQSPVTARFRHVHVRNPGMLQTPASDDPQRLRARLRLPAGKKIVLFVSDNLRNHRKGIELLLAAVQGMPRREQVQLVGIGHPTDCPPDLAVRFTGRITDEKVLADYYASADLLVNPSVMENSPLTIIEALSLGTPVVSFAVGGVPELINGANGVVVAERSPAALSAAIANALFGQTFERERVRASAQAHEATLVFEDYRSIYHELLHS